MYKFFRYIVFLGCIMLMTACGTSEEEIVESAETAEENQVVELRLAELHFEGYPTTDACIHFAQLVKERTDGHINITVYPNSELGTENEVITKVMNGEVDLARVNAAPLSSYSQNIIPMLLPYLINSSDHMLAVMSSDLGMDVLNNLDNNIVGLCWYYSGSRSFYSKNPITKLEDLQGLNIRIQNSSLMEDMIKCLGANPIIMDWQNMYDAFEDGTLDAGENDVSSYLNFAHGLVAPYYTMDTHVFSPSVVIMNEEILNQLTPEEQEIIKECAVESMDYELGLWQAYEDEAKESLIADGVTFSELSSEEKERLRAACEPLYDKYAADCMDIVEEIRKLEQ